MSNKKQGIIYIILAGFFFSLMTFFVRISGDLSTMEKAFFRNAVAAVVSVIMLAKSNLGFRINKGSLPDLLMRSICGTTGLICNFYAIDHLVLSDANMLNKLSPFFAIIFSYFLLKEKLTLFQGVAVVVAFIGALFIIKPTGNMANSAAFVGMMGGAGAGAAYTYVRLLGKRGVNGKLVIMCFSAFSCLTAAVFLIGHFAPMAWWQIVAMIGAGFGGAGGQIFVTKAYYYAPAKELSVFDYSQILFSALMGFVVLGQKPDLYSILGYVIICSTAIVMFLYNKKRG